MRVSLAPKFAEVAQQAEHNVANVDVTGSSPVFRSIFRCTFTLLTRVERTHIIDDARLAQLAKSSRLVSGRSSVRTRQRAPTFSADVVEQADTPARGPGGASHAGSNPAVGTNVFLVRYPASHPAPVAQLAAQRSPKPSVGGSSPSRCATFLNIPSWRNGIRAALRTQCPRDIPVRVRGKGPTISRAWRKRQTRP